MMEPFTQGDHLVSDRSQQGIGLGMSIISGIIEAMGGTLEIESKVGKGTKITIKAPFKELDNSQVKSFNDHRQNFQDNISSTTPPLAIKVLVVDDNRKNRNLASRMLHRLGALSQEASSGEQALEILEKEPFDCVLMDCSMPGGIDGFETTRRLRSMKDLKKQPYVIALTAHAMQDYRSQCIKAGMDNYLSKPYRLQDLSEILQSMAMGAQTHWTETQQEKYEAPFAEPP